MGLSTAAHGERVWVALGAVLALGSALACKRFGAREIDASPALPTAAPLASSGADAARPDHDYEAELPAELRAPPPWGDDVRQATCGKRSACTLMRERPAGTTPSGVALSVVSVRTAAPDEDREVREHWVLGRKGGKLAVRARVASEWVETSSPIDDTLDVGAFTLTTKITSWPTSAWQSWPARTFRLWPPALERLSETPHHRGGLPVSGSTDVDFVAGAGHADYQCETRSGESLPIPAAPPSTGFEPSRGLGRCGVVADGSKGHGWMVQGSADSASGHLRIARIGDALWIEAHDDKWTDGDSLEIRTGRPAGFMGCMEEDLAAPTATMVSAKGAVRAGPLAVTLAREAGATRVFRVTAKDMSGVAVLLHDDDGAGPPRVLGTVPPAATELGGFAHVAGVACGDTAEGPALVPHVGESD